MPPAARLTGVFMVIALGFSASATAQTRVGGPGPDRLVAANSGGLLFGGGGADTLVGGPGNDQLYGGRAGNKFFAGGGNNYVEGGTGDDIVTAGNGLNTIYGGSGHDTIRAGNGNNYVDAGGAPDTITLGNGNNVVHSGSGGAAVVVGSGANTIYLPNGTLRAGGGVNRIYTTSAYGTTRIDCGGNPGSVLYVNDSSGSNASAIGKAQASGRFKDCAKVELYSGPGAIKAQSAALWEQFNLIGTDRADKLLGGHGGGSIDGKGGDNILWADQNQDTGGAAAQGNTTTLRAGNGANQIFGGRGTNLVTVGSGDNFIRGGAWKNDITTNGGNNNIRLQGGGVNTVTLNGGSSYVESFTSGQVQINCVNGAKAIVVHAKKKPGSNCGPSYNAKSKKGENFQLQGLQRILDSDAIVDNAPLPGANGIGVPRPGQAL